MKQVMRIRQNTCLSFIEAMVPPLRVTVHGQLLFAYIMAGRANGMLYVGATSNPVQRAGHHKQGVVEGFTRKY
jgi:hypothetical protein